MESRLDVNLQDGLAAVADGLQNQNYLGDSEVVEKLVRGFFARVFEIRGDFHQSQDDKQAVGRINALCAKHGKIFLGEDDTYTSQPWNSPYRLGNYLRATVPDVGDHATPGEAYFQFLAVQALNAAIAVEDGHMTDEQVKVSMSEVLDDAVDVLLGRKLEARS